MAIQNIMSYLQEVDLGGTFPPFVSFEGHFWGGSKPFSCPNLAASSPSGRSRNYRRRAFQGLDSVPNPEGVHTAGSWGRVSSSYCVALHYQVLRSLGVPRGQLDEIVINYRKAALSTSYAALLDFAIKLAMHAPWVSGEDIDALRNHGYTDDAILEAILVTGLASFLCTLSRELSPSPDFEPRAILASNNVSQPEGVYVGGTAGPYLRTVERSAENFPPFAIFRERFGFIPNLFHAQTLGRMCSKWRWSCSATYWGLKTSSPTCTRSASSW